MAAFPDELALTGQEERKYDRYVCMNYIHVAGLAGQEVTQRNDFQIKFHGQGFVLFLGFFWKVSR